MPKLERKIVIKIIKKAFYIWTGLSLLVIGLIFSLIPLIPGFVPFAIGIAFIAKGSSTFREQHYIKNFLRFIKNRLKNEKGVMRKMASFF